MYLLGIMNESGGWDIGSFLENSTTTIKVWGNYFIILIGVIMVIWAAWQIGSGLMSHGKKQTNWFIAVALLIVGGAFLVGGFGFVENISKGGKQTIEDLGTGSSIIMMYEAPEASIE